MVLRLATALALATSAFAGEYAMLANGASLRIDRHESNGASVRVYLNGGFADFRASSVLRFEQEYTAPAAPAIPQEHPNSVPVELLIQDAARRWGLPAPFLRSIMRAESAGHPEAVSPKGAVGLMQVMPSTAQQMGLDPTDPRQNVEAGARYLSALLRKYSSDPYQVRKALAAYNAGPGAVDRYQGIPPYRETIEYVERVLRQWHPAAKADAPAR